ncbi:MAG: phosphate-starvation-inducible PsiE family protein [Cyanobium sp.]
MKTLRWLFADANYLRVVDRGEQWLAKLLGLVLLLVMAAATFQLIGVVALAVIQPETPWLAGKLNAVLGDLLTLLIAVEVLQNITSYLRRHVVQIELVLLTAMTAVARKVIVLPPGAENKPQLLGGLGIAVLALAAAFWLVRSVNNRKPPARTGPTRWNREQDP